MRKNNYFVKKIEFKGEILMGKNKEEKRIPIGVENVLKAADKDPAKASSILEEKIKEECNKMVSKQTEETKNISKKKSSQ